MAPSAPKQPAPSLLPYLQGPDGQQRVKLSLLREPGAGGERSYPFRLLDDAPPYWRVIEGSFQSDAGSTLKEILLIMEKDRPNCGSDGLRRVGNAQLDQAWQELFKTQQNRGERLIVATQSDVAGNLVRQAPLFFCRKRTMFFHPVCPSCGLDLSLCTDDDFLRTAGLSPYSSSAKRYLYCRPCCSLGMQELYTYERDHSDPLSIKDRWSLLESFGKIEELMDPDGTFPCVRCAEHTACFGPERAARSRVTPFSFYPFYVLLWESPSLHGSDFLAFLSGADRAELEQLLDPLSDEGRIARLRDRKLAGAALTFHAPPDDRFFLEILFLKLSYLAEVLRHALVGQRRPSRVSRERIWVRLAPLGKDLPLFWNFSISMVEGVDPKGEATLASEELSHLGLFWFETLVLNSNVSASELLHAVADRLAQGGEGTEGTEGRLDQLLAPQHLFWNPALAVPPRAEWLPFWERARSLGLQLLERGKAPYSAEAILAPLSELLGEIRGVMFSAPPAPVAGAVSAPAPAPEQQAQEALLQRVVAGLLPKYGAEVEAPAEPQQGSREPYEPDDYETATVIITPGARQTGAALAAEDDALETVLLKREEDDAITETVILTPEAMKERQMPAGEAALETVLIRALPDTVQASSQQEQLPETVVLQPHHPRPKGGPR